MITFKNHRALFEAARRPIPGELPRGHRDQPATKRIVNGVELLGFPIGWGSNGLANRLSAWGIHHLDDLAQHHRESLVHPGPKFTDEDLIEFTRILTIHGRKPHESWEPKDEKEDD